MASYATIPVLGLYCIPDIVTLDAQATAAGIPVPQGLRESLMNATGPIGSYATKAQLYVGSLERCWPLLLGTLLFTVVTSYIFLFSLKCFAKPLIYLVLLFLLLFFFSIGGFFVIGEQLPRPEPIQAVDNTTNGVLVTSAPVPVVPGAPTVVTIAPTAR